MYIRVREPVEHTSEVYDNKLQYKDGDREPRPEQVVGVPQQVDDGEVGEEVGEVEGN